MEEKCKVFYEKSKQSFAGGLVEVKLLTQIFLQ